MLAATSCLLPCPRHGGPQGRRAAVPANGGHALRWAANRVQAWTASAPPSSPCDTRHWRTAVVWHGGAGLCCCCAQICNGLLAAPVAACGIWPSGGLQFREYQGPCPFVPGAVHNLADVHLGTSCKATLCIALCCTWRTLGRSKHRTPGHLAVCAATHVHVNSSRHELPGSDVVCWMEAASVCSSSKQLSGGMTAMTSCSVKRFTGRWRMYHDLVR